MLTVQGIYNKGKVKIKETVPDFEMCEVFITFLPPAYEIKHKQIEKKETAEEKERREAFNFLINAPKISLPEDFDYKKELKNALKEKYEHIT